MKLLCVLVLCSVMAGISCGWKVTTNYATAGCAADSVQIAQFELDGGSCTPVACAAVSDFFSEVRCEEYLKTTRDLFTNPVTVLQYANDASAVCDADNTGLKGSITTVANCFANGESFTYIDTCNSGRYWSRNCHAGCGDCFSTYEDFSFAENTCTTIGGSPAASVQFSCTGQLPASLLPPVTPVAEPVAEPVAIPVAEPVATPVADPPTQTPVAEPTATPVADPPTATPTQTPNAMPIASPMATPESSPGSDAPTDVPMSAGPVDAPATVVGPTNGGSTPRQRVSGAVTLNAANGAILSLLLCGMVAVLHW